MSTSAEVETFRELLEGLSNQRVREICIEAVRAIRQGPGDEASTRVLDIETIRREVVRLLREERPHVEGSNAAKATQMIMKDWATPLLEFFLWMQRTGLCFILGRSHSIAGVEPNPYVVRVRLLPAGIAFFGSRTPHDEHPLVPGWARRLQTRLPSLPLHVVDSLVDGHECFDHGLLRPAVILIGVTFEGLAAAVYQRLVDLNFPLAAALPAAARTIAGVRSVIGERFPLPASRADHAAALSARTAANNACNFADQLRDRRNDGAHPLPRFGFDDREEVEELFVSAARHIPGLWAMA